MGLCRPRPVCWLSLYMVVCPGGRVPRWPTVRAGRVCARPMPSARLDSSPDAEELNAQNATWGWGQRPRQANHGARWWRNRAATLLLPQPHVRWGGPPVLLGSERSSRAARLSSKGTSHHQPKNCVFDLTGPRIEHLGSLATLPVAGGEEGEQTRHTATAVPWT